MISQKTGNWTENRTVYCICNIEVMTAHLVRFTETWIRTKKIRYSCNRVLQRRISLLHHLGHKRRACSKLRIVIAGSFPSVFVSVTRLRSAQLTQGGIIVHLLFRLGTIHKPCSHFFRILTSSPQTLPLLQNSCYVVLWFFEEPLPPQWLRGLCMTPHLFFHND